MSPEDLASSVVCLHSLFSTTRRNLLAYPRHVYDSLRNQTDVADASEAGHMLERLAQVVFWRCHHTRGTDYYDTV